MQNNPNKQNRNGFGRWIRHRRLIICFLVALGVFIILYRVSFYVMGAFAVIGAVWVIREYNKKEDEP